MIRQIAKIEEFARHRSETGAVKLDEAGKFWRSQTQAVAFPSKLTRSRSHKNGSIGIDLNSSGLAVEGIEIKLSTVDLGNALPLN